MTCTASTTRFAQPRSVPTEQAQATATLLLLEAMRRRLPAATAGAR
jgi:hypothetical protein